MKAATKLQFLSGALGLAVCAMTGCGAGQVGSNGAEGSRRASGGGGESCRVVLEAFSEAGVTLAEGAQVTLGVCATHANGVETCTVQAGGQTASVLSAHLGPCAAETVEAAQPEEETEEAPAEPAQEEEECGPEPHHKLVGDRCLPSCGRAMGDAARAKHGSEDAYLSFGSCLQAHPSSPCDASKGHRQVETWDCGATCCIYPEGDSGAGSGEGGEGTEGETEGTEGETEGTATESGDACSVAACCGVLTDESNLIPAEGRTFDGEVANDNFCFIADQGDCCYQTHCHGDWLAGYEAAKGC